GWDCGKARQTAQITIPSSDAGCRLRAVFIVLTPGVRAASYIDPQSHPPCAASVPEPAASDYRMHFAETRSRRAGSRSASANAGARQPVIYRRLSAIDPAFDLASRRFLGLFAGVFPGFFGASPGTCTNCPNRGGTAAALTIGPAATSLFR